MGRAGAPLVKRGEGRLAKVWMDAWELKAECSGNWIQCAKVGTRGLQELPDLVRPG